MHTVAAATLDPNCHVLSCLHTLLVPRTVAMRRRRRCGLQGCGQRCDIAVVIWLKQLPVHILKWIWQTACALPSDRNATGAWLVWLWLGSVLLLPLARRSLAGTPILTLHSLALASTAAALLAPVPRRELRNAFIVVEIVPHNEEDRLTDICTSPIACAAIAAITRLVLGLRYFKLINPALCHSAFCGGNDVCGFEHLWAPCAVDHWTTVRAVDGLHELWLRASVAHDRYSDQEDRTWLDTTWDKGLVFLPQ